VLDSTKNRENFLRLFKRYFKNNSKDRLEKLIIKYTTILKKYGKKKDYKSFEEIQKEREILIQNQSVRSNRDSDLNKYLNEEQETLSPGSS
jgi:bifunctional DNA-binding transcriptional regulator/antitoxin component of YhaV-PrlF toxin-antitoxin module